MFLSNQSPAIPDFYGLPSSLATASPEKAPMICARDKEPSAAHHQGCFTPAPRTASDAESQLVPCAEQKHIARKTQKRSHGLVRLLLIT